MLEGSSKWSNAVSLACESVILANLGYKPETAFTVINCNGFPNMQKKNNTWNQKWLFLGVFSQKNERFWAAFLKNCKYHQSHHFPVVISFLPDKTVVSNAETTVYCNITTKTKTSIFWKSKFTIRALEYSGSEYSRLLGAGWYWVELRHFSQDDWQSVGGDYANCPRRLKLRWVSVPLAVNTSVTLIFHWVLEAHTRGLHNNKTTNVFVSNISSFSQRE